MKMNSNNKVTYYNQAKINADKLGIDADDYKKMWKKSNAEFWRSRNERLVKEIKKRNKLFKRIELIADKKGLKRRYANPYKKSYDMIKEEYQRVREYKKSDKTYTPEDITKLIKAKQFDKVFQNIVETVKPLTATQGRMLWTELSTGRKMTLEVIVKGSKNVRYIPLNDNNYDRFNNLIINFGKPTYYEETAGSDSYEAYSYESILKISAFENYSVKRKIKNKNSAFFEYINTSKVGLNRYQIYSEEEMDETDSEGLPVFNERMKKRDNCLIFTLRLCGISPAVLNRIKLAFTTRFIAKYNDKGDRKIHRSMAYTSKKNLKDVADIIRKNVVLHWINPQKELKTSEFKSSTETTEKIDIAIFKNHYFIYEKTIYSKFAVTNNEKLGNEKRFGDIIAVKDGKNCYDTRTKMSSLSLIALLYKLKYFVKKNMTMFHESYDIDTLDNEIYLEDIENEQQLFTVKQKKPVDKTTIFYADTETYVNPKFFKYHSLKSIGCVAHVRDLFTTYHTKTEKYQNSEFKSAERLAVEDWLDRITNQGKSDAICYFHNLKYDLNVLEKYMNIMSKCEKDNNIYEVVVFHKGSKISLRDSYKIIPEPLAKCPEMFELSKEYRKKEALAYEYYTHKNDHWKKTKIDIYCEYLSIEEKKILINNLENDIEGIYSYDKENQTFDAHEYYQEYLRLDCMVLKQSMIKFDVIINDITNKRMSVYDFLTISSLSDKYMQFEGCYDDVYEVTGNLREYISRAVYGGKVDVNKIYLKKRIEKIMADFDLVSSYPSAIKRLCVEFGIPLGKAKRVKKKDLKTILNKKELTYAVLTVKITKVNKIQQMPFIAVKTENGSTQYINEPPKEEIVIDMHTLADYIKFHEIEYEIKDGVYWNEGYNKKMGDVIQQLFDERLKKKYNAAGEETALGNIIKLMLNSAYGKTILSKSGTKKVIVKEIKYVKNKLTGKFEAINRDNFENYIYNHFNVIKTYRRINKNAYEVEFKAIDTSYNRAHIGCAILSMSKRLMNEVFDIANDLKKPIYYTDTDSLHCENKDIPEIADKFREIHGRELVGKQLGQFHVDFKMKGAKPGADIFAVESIFLGKKSYHDRLESVDVNDKPIFGCHNRMKGVTKEGLEHMAMTKYDGDYTAMYRDLATGKSLNFLLNPKNVITGKKKVLMDIKYGEVATKGEFHRRVQF